MVGAGARGRAAGDLDPRPDRGGAGRELVRERVEAAGGAHEREVEHATVASSVRACLAAPAGEDRGGVG